MKKNILNLIYFLLLSLITNSCFSEVTKSEQEELFKSALVKEHLAGNYPKDAIVVVISRAYEYGSGKNQFCSPDITVSNFNNVGVKSLIFAASYFQTINGTRKQVGQSHGKYTIEPNDATTRGFYQLETESCRDITAYGRVTLCLMRDGRDCTDVVKLSDSGRIPAYAYSLKGKKVKDDLINSVLNK